MSDERKVADAGSHDLCHNPCTSCNKKGYLDNDEICPACAGTGCVDRKYCEPAGGLGCDA